jgi:hypothetical protein
MRASVSTGGVLSVGRQVAARVVASRAAIRCQIVRLLVSGSALSLPSALRAQGADTIPTITLNNGVGEAEWLPYGRRWALVGRRDTDGGRVDAVLVHVRREESPTGSDSFSRCWIKPAVPQASDTATKFRVVLERLALGEKYQVTVEQFGRLNPRELSTALRAGFLKAIETARKNEGLRADDLTRVLQDEVRKQLGATVLKTARRVIRQLNGECKAVPVDTLTISIEQEDRRRLLRAAVAAVDLELTKGSLDSVKSKAARLAESGEFSELMRRLAAPELTMLRPTDGSQLKAWLQGEAITAESALERLSTIDDQCAEGRTAFLTTDACRTFQGAIDLVRNIRLGGADVETHATTADSAESSLIAELREVYAAIGSAMLSTYSWGKDAESEKLRIGTQFSYGAASFSPSDGRAGGRREAAITATALKFYWYPVDKSLPDPYFGRTAARWSLAVGVVTGDIHYRGQKLESIPGGRIPIVGLGWDIPRPRNVAGIVGAMFFQQPSANPAAPSNSSRLRLAPVLLLGFDVDVFNRIAGLIK